MPFSSQRKEGKSPFIILIFEVFIFPVVSQFAFMPEPVIPVFQVAPPSLEIKIPPLTIRKISLGLERLVVVIPVSSHTTD
jgi:hypothetical protein